MDNIYSITWEIGCRDIYLAGCPEKSLLPVQPCFQRALLHEVQRPESEFAVDVAFVAFVKNGPAQQVASVLPMPYLCTSN